MLALGHLSPPSLPPAYSIDAAPSPVLLQVLAEQGERASPRIIGGGLVVDIGALVVEEAVVDARVDVDLALLAGFLDRRVDVLGRLRRHERVLLGEEAERGARELRVVGF